MPLLEVIALTAGDARAAEDGGADRLEVVADMAADGLTPDPQVVAEMRRATRLPLRAMLRANSGFRTTAPELDRLRRAAEGLAEAGVDGFVLGFLDPFGAVDAGSVAKLVSTLPDDLPWTFHRALDHATDPFAGWAAVQVMGCDAVLTAGSARGVESGLEVLSRRAAENPAAARLLMAGGGLRRKHVASLAAAGIGAFHVGTAVRPDGSWDATVDPSLVGEWRALVTAASS